MTHTTLGEAYRDLDDTPAAQLKDLEDGLLAFEDEGEGQVTVYDGSRFVGLIVPVFGTDRRSIIGWTARVRGRLGTPGGWMMPTVHDAARWLIERR